MDIYDEVALTQGWSPQDLSPPFDLPALLVESYRLSAPNHHVPARLVTR